MAMTNSWNEAETNWLKNNAPQDLNTPKGPYGLSKLPSYIAAQSQSKSSSSSSYAPNINYTPPPAESIYKAPSHPTNFGLTGKVDPVDVTDFLLDTPEDVPYRYNPTDVSPYMDQYQKWAESGFISREVQPEDTVAWQMNNLLDEQSPYITQAKQQGKELAASRGLLNSSMAAGSSQRAAIESALPIAQQDASTYFSQGINNQNLANQFSLARQNAGMQGIMEMDRLQQTLDAEFEKLNSQIDMFNTELGMKADSFNSTMQFESAMAAQAFAEQQKITRAGLWMDADKLAADVALTLEGIRANVAVAGAQLTEQSSQFSETMAYNISANYQNGLLSIWQNPNITAEQSSAAEDRWNQLYTNTPLSINNYAQAYS